MLAAAAVPLLAGTQTASQASAIGGSAAHADTDSTVMLLTPEVLTKFLAVRQDLNAYWIANKKQRNKLWDLEGKDNQLTNITWVGCTTVGTDSNGNRTARDGPMKYTETHANGNVYLDRPIFADSAIFDDSVHEECQEMGQKKINYVYGVAEVPAISAIFTKHDFPPSQYARISMAILTAGFYIRSGQTIIGDKYSPGVAESNEMKNIRYVKQRYGEIFRPICGESVTDPSVRFCPMFKWLDGEWIYFMVDM